MSTMSKPVAFVYLTNTIRPFDPGNAAIALGACPIKLARTKRAEAALRMSRVVLAAKTWSSLGLSDRRAWV